LKSLLKFCNKFGADKGIIVTKNLLERREIDGREILLIPVWVFLLYRNSMVLGDV
jgi:predicted AAA+ superfamily ATPase